MNKPRVLIDLTIAMNKAYCGIATENRLLFKMLSQATSIDAVGMLSAQTPTVFSSYKKRPTPAEGLQQTSQFFHHALGDAPGFKNQCISKLKLASLVAFMQRHFELYPIDPLYREVIWRQVFTKSLAGVDKATILEKDFYFSDLTEQHLRAGAYFKKPLSLPTHGYDYAIFLEPTPLAVASTTKKIVRFHDAIPLTEPDFVSARFARGKLHTLDLCAKEAYFVCNSEPSLNTLLQLRPILEKRATVIPCALATHYHKVQDESTLKKIIHTRLSTALLTSEQLAKVKASIIDLEKTDYLFHLATLDPKKNQVTLIRAWEKYNYLYGKTTPIKLIMAGNPGPFSEEVQAAMRPHLLEGHLLHLSDLSVDEMPYLFSHAKAFIFPSYAEGFGLPPMEAMQCECPTIVSDIPTHRWVMGEASLYCDPYDVNDMVKCMEQLLIGENALALRQQCINAGLRQVKKYTVENISVRWTNLFNDF